MSFMPSMPFLLKTVPSTAPFLRGAAVTTLGTSGTSRSVSIPSPSAADTSVIALYTDAACTLALTGYTALITGSTAHLLYKLNCTGSEGTSVTVTGFNTGDKTGAIGYALGNVSTTQAPSKSTVATGSSTAPRSTVVTASWGSHANYFLSFFTGLATLSINNYPTGYNDGNSKAGISTACAAAWDEKTSASDTPGAYTTSATVLWTAYGVVFKGV